MNKLQYSIEATLTNLSFFSSKTLFALLSTTQSTLCTSSSRIYKYKYLRSSTSTDSTKRKYHHHLGLVTDVAISTSSRQDVLFCACQ